MKIRWTPEAATDLEQIRDYLLQHRPELARRTMLALYGRIRLLKSFPHVGRSGSKANTRELVLTRLPYIVVYRVKEEFVEVLSIRHAARRPEA